jgi:hypothetical protein
LSIFKKKNLRTFLLNYGHSKSLTIMSIAQNLMQQTTMHARIRYNTNSTNMKQIKMVICEGIELFKLPTTTQMSYKTKLVKYKTPSSHKRTTTWKQKDELWRRSDIHLWIVLTTCEKCLLSQPLGYYHKYNNTKCILHTYFSNFEN